MQLKVICFSYTIFMFHKIHISILKHNDMLIANVSKNEIQAWMMVRNTQHTFVSKCIDIKCLASQISHVDHVDQNTCSWNYNSILPHMINFSLLQVFHFMKILIVGWLMKSFQLSCDHKTSLFYK